MTRLKWKRRQINKRQSGTTGWKNGKNWDLVSVSQWVLVTSQELEKQKEAEETWISSKWEVISASRP